MAVTGVGPVARATTTADPDWAAALRCTSPIRPTVTLTATGFTAYDAAYGYRYDDTLFTRSRWASPPSTDTVYNLEVYGLLWCQRCSRWRAQHRTARIGSSGS